MNEPQEFVGHHVRLRSGFLWRCRSCKQPIVVVGTLSSQSKSGQWLRGVCPNCMDEANIRHYESQTPVEANWNTKLTMTRDTRWPASISKGVFDLE